MSDGKMWEIEDGFFSGGVGTICGVDEAGRGPQSLYRIQTSVTVL